MHDLKNKMHYLPERENDDSEIIEDNPIIRTNRYLPLRLQSFPPSSCDTSLNITFLSA